MISFKLKEISRCISILDKKEGQNVEMDFLIAVLVQRKKPQVTRANHLLALFVIVIY